MIAFVFKPVYAASRAYGIAVGTVATVASQLDRRDGNPLSEIDSPWSWFVIVVVVMVVDLDGDGNGDVEVDAQQ